MSEENNNFRGAASVDVSACLGCAVAKCVRGHSFPLYCRYKDSICTAIDPNEINKCDDDTLDNLVSERYVASDSNYINKAFIDNIFSLEKMIVNAYSFAAIDYTERS